MDAVKRVEAGFSVSVLEMVKAYGNVSGQSLPFRIVERRTGDLAQSFADPSEAGRLLARKACLVIEDICRDAWRWQSVNPHGYGSKP